MEAVTNPTPTQSHRLEESSVVSDALDQLLRRASAFPLLRPEEEIDLAQRIERGDLVAKERLVASNVRLVVSIARRYQGHGLTLPDLVQEGMLGLIRAAEKFDWRKGYRFSTYATLWIRQAIQRGLDNSGRLIRLPANVSGKVRRVGRMRAELAVQLERDPEPFEVAERAGLPVDEVEALMAMDYTPPSLDARVGDEGDAATLGELQSDDGPGPDEEVETTWLAERVAVALDRLPEQEREVVELRFGMEQEQRSRTQVARDLRMSPAKVEELERSALRRLAHMPDVEALRDAA
ncbi:MAG TPA: sigma-70 family RNA polymerase sigma factor [Baekduia sp.]|nr:sigma-70 family RNA polymerase sigma factor [Baekduia sp.]